MSNKEIVSLQALGNSKKGEKTENENVCIEMTSKVVSSFLFMRAHDQITQTTEASRYELKCFN